MRKLMMVALILGLTLGITIPALAAGDISFEQKGSGHSGKVSSNVTVTNKGNYASLCVPTSQPDNSGNFNNLPGVFQDASRSGGIEPEGESATFDGTVTTDCPSTTNQSSAASAK